jgi:hypothetical protein
VVDEAYLAAVRALPCCGCGAAAPSDPHHAATWLRGLGQKCDDDKAIPLCRACHDEFHDGRGRFAGWTKEDRRDWCSRAIARTQAAVARRAPAAEEGGVPW